MIITPAKKQQSKTLLTLSRDHNSAVAHTVQFINTNSKKPLVVAFGNTEVFNDTDFDVAYIPVVSNLDDDIQTILNTVKSSKHDSLLVDSATLLLRLLRADVAGSESPTLQEYGIINNRLVNALIALRSSVPVFATTSAFVLNEDATKKTNRDVWELDLTSNLRASIFPLFGAVNYVQNDGTVVTDRKLAVLGKAPSKAPSKPNKPSRPSKA